MHLETTIEKRNCWKQAAEETWVNKTCVLHVTSTHGLERPLTQKYLAFIIWKEEKRTNLFRLLEEKKVASLGDLLKV